MAKQPYRSVMFAIPAASSVVEVDLVMSLFQELGPFVGRGWEIALQFAVGNNGIHLARNFLVRRFLDSPCTDLFFIDSDIAWEPGAVVKMIDHPVDLVLGLYRLKHPQEGYTYYADSPECVPDPQHGLVKIRGGPAGFMRIRRTVLEKMVETLAPMGEGGWMAEPMRPDYALPMLFNFAPRKDPTTGLVHQAGEDMDFCLKWGEMGGEVWMDPDLTLHHIGKAKYSSNFWTTYNTKKRIVHDKEWQEIVDPKPNGDLARFEQLTQGVAP